jgi:hypothetical protein
MPFTDPPRFAAFEHCGSRAGYEVAFLRGAEAAILIEGHTSAVMDGEPFAASYAIELDSRWRTRTARVRGQSLTGVQEVDVQADDDGCWRVNGSRVPALDGCIDLDLELSSLTNAFPVRRLALQVGKRAHAPAAWVRALDLRVERLEQQYERIADTSDGHARFDYVAPDLNFRSELEYDHSGLIVAYPGIAVRNA